MQSRPERPDWEQRIAEARIDTEIDRLRCLKVADMMDKVGNKVAQLEIAMIKVQAPRMALRSIDDARSMMRIQAHGGGGVTADFGLAKNYACDRLPSRRSFGHALCRAATVYSPFTNIAATNESCCPENRKFTAPSQGGCST